MSQPGAAVVVIGRNEAAKLDRCFASVRAVDYPPDLIDLVYVDSGSSDHSVGIARRCGARIVRLTAPPFSAARGREAGWRTTTAPFIFFLDGDCEIAPGFISRALAEFADPKVAVVCGHLRESNPVTGSRFVQRNIGMQFLGLPNGPGSLMGGNHLDRRSAIEEVDGFDLYWESMENTDLGRRLRRKGHLVVRVDEPMAVHYTSVLGWGALFRRGFRYGYGDSRYLARLPGELLRFRDYHDLGPRLTDVAWFLGLSAAVLVGGLFWSWSGLAVGAGLFPVLVLAKAWKSRRKTPNWAERIQFALYAQMVCVATIVGHLAYWYDALRGATRIIDYWRIRDSARPSPADTAEGAQTDTAIP